MLDLKLALRLLGMRLKDRALIGPETVQIDLTDKCTNNCLGCWARSPFLRDDDHYDTLEKGTLDTAFVLNLLLDLHANDVERIFLGGGGDPLCHPDLDKILARIKELGMACTLNTNLVTATEPMLERFVDLQLDELIISLWAADGRNYSRLHPNQSEGTFRRLEDKLLLLRDLKKGPHTAPPTIKLYNVICSLNYRQIPDMIDHAARMGVEEVEFSVLDPIPRRTNVFLLDPKQIKWVQDFFAEFAQLPPLFVHHELFLRRLGNVDVHKGVYDNTVVESIPCAAGWFYARVTTVGQVHSCLKAHRIPAGELSDYSFPELWYGGGQNKFRENTVQLKYDNPFLMMVGHDIDFALPGCYRICDNLGTNYQVQHRLGQLSPTERAALDAMEHEARQGADTERLRQVFDEHCPQPDPCQPCAQPEPVDGIEVAADHRYLPALIDRDDDQDAIGRKLELLDASGPIRIPVVLGNVARLPGILSLIRQKTGRPVDPADARFDFRPLATAADRIGPHLKALSESLGFGGIELAPDVGSIETTLGRFAHGLSDYSEPDLLRALGVLCNAPLIGPRTFHLDVANGCNTDCAYCWFHSPFSADRPDADAFDARWKAQLMPWPMFENLVDDLHAVGCTEDVVLSGKGEPLIHPRILDMVGHLKKRGLFTTLFTNGLRLDEKIAAGCIEHKLDLLYVSLSAATDKTFRSLQTKLKPGAFDAICENVRRLIRLRNESGSGLPKVVMVDVLTNLNFHEVEAFAKLSADLGADLLRYQLAAIEPYNRPLALSEKQLAAVKADMEKAGSVAANAGMDIVDNIHAQLESDGTDWSQDKYLRSGCLAGWAFSRAWADGTLSLCCSPKPIGSLADARFAYWWNGPEYDAYRLAAKSIHQHEDLPFADGTPLWTDICRRCPNYEGIGYLEKILEELGMRNPMELDR